MEKIEQRKAAGNRLSCGRNTGVVLIEMGGAGLGNFIFLTSQLDLDPVREAPLDSNEMLVKKARSKLDLVY